MTQPAPAPAPAPAPNPAPAPAPTPPAPAPAPVPAPQPAPVPAPAPAPPQQHGQQPRQSDPGTGEDLPYYQEGVAWRNLPPDQQLAYWMHRSRKHEDRVNAMKDYDELRGIKSQYEQLVTQHQTEHERAVAEARRQGETTAMARANTMLVEAYVRAAAAARGVDDEAVADFIETTRLDAFIDPAGQVDTAKVYRQVNRMAGGPPAVTAPGVPGAPAVPAPPQVLQGQPQPGQQPAWPQQPGQQQYAPGGVIPPGTPIGYGPNGQPIPVVPAAPQWPGQIPAAPQQPGQPGQQPAPPAGPDFGQGVFVQAPPSGLEAGRAAARARFGTGNNTNSSNSQAA